MHEHLKPVQSSLPLAAAARIIDEALVAAFNGRFIAVPGGVLVLDAAGSGCDAVRTRGIEF